MDTMKKRSRAFRKIAEGMNEALSIARGETKPAKLFVPAEINVHAIRGKLQLSQEDFARSFGFTVDQIRGWEQGRCRPLGGNRAYLMLIDLNHEAVLDILRSAPKAKAA